MDQGDYGLCLYQQERKTGRRNKTTQKKEKEVQRQKDRERVIKVNEWEKVYKREGESTEIREWMKEKTGGEKKAELTGVRRTAVIRLRVSVVVKVHCLGKRSNVGQCNVFNENTLLLS